jgi:hypothetical protein
MRTHRPATSVLRRALTRHQANAAGVPEAFVQATITVAAAVDIGSPPATLHPIWVMP